ncbi:MAG: Fic family protein [Alphaproteobacteria bacterium]|nr:Fic family protein [Alphaproteobacteria bacterium]MBU0795008.1 Fic family protein [Alphaproteobacteria bacterium]MBU0875050.1 Fic family protein [Alphaproteobacteria bacterium]MBU1768799.1 Fic family protein [Alphaproteobacteria bacterium]
MALKPTYVIPALPPVGAVETRAVLREAARAHRYLAELKGRAAAIPNQGILIDTLSLQEAKASSEIENIVTTQDEMFQASLFPDHPGSPAAKEVALYRDALRCGFDRLREQHGLLSNNALIAMFQVLKRTTGGFRNTPGTALLNEASGDIVYVPPQDGADVVRQMTELERFINDDDQSDLDPLVKMAIIHHQFESIHPFPDGNGRIGRIINVLYLTRQGLLDIPILYLSRAITARKADYYRLLQAVRETGEWEEWLIYMLRAVGDTARETLDLIEGIRRLMADYKNRLRADHGRIYSQDLLNNLFRHPYTRIEYVQHDLNVTRQTAARYLDQLAETGMLIKHQSGRNNYYINAPLVALFSDGERSI